jgi:hypothetical protein
VSAGCATVPADMPRGHWVGILPKESDVYVHIVHAKTNPLLKSALRRAGLLTPEMDLALDYTAESYAGIELMRKGPPRVSLVCLGSYPTLLMDIALCCDQRWQRESAPGPGGPIAYWKNPESGLEVAWPQGYLVLASWGRVADMLPRVAAPPVRALSPELISVMEKSELCFILPIGIDSRVLESLNLDLQKVSIAEAYVSATLEPAPATAATAATPAPTPIPEAAGQYRLRAVFTIANETGARFFSTLFKGLLVVMLRRAKIESAGKLQRISVDRQGSTVAMDRLFLTAEELSALIADLLNPPREPATGTK